MSTVLCSCGCWSASGNISWSGNQKRWSLGIRCKRRRGGPEGVQSKVMHSGSGGWVGGSPCPTSVLIVIRCRDRSEEDGSLGSFICIQ